MASIENIKASDGTGNASVATITTTRAALATTILVNTVQGINAAGFMGSMGTPHTFTDPVTSETITVISEATAVDFAGHVSGATLIIDTIAPGYTDAGSVVGDIVIIKPTTQYANNVATTLAVAHNDDGTLKANSATAGVLADNSIDDAALFTDNVDPELRASENLFDHIVSGCVLSGTGYGSTLAWSLTAGIVYINGRRLTVASASGNVNASKDTYFDLLDPGTGTVATLVNTAGNIVANNTTPSPALAANSVRIGIVVSGATSIAAATSVNQGQETMVLPIVSTVPYATTDSLGNLICPRDPNRKLLGYRQDLTGAVVSSASFVDYTLLNCVVDAPANRRLKIIINIPNIYAGTDQGANLKVVDVTSTVSSSNLAIRGSTALREINGTFTWHYTVPAGGARNFKVQWQTLGGGSSNTNPGASLAVELA